MDHSFEQLCRRLESFGGKRVNVARVFTRLQRDFVDDASVLVEDERLPKSLRVAFADGALPAINPILESRAFPSCDGSVKYMFRLEGDAWVEGVFMPAQGRTTLCISSQVGCAMGCTFCATGSMGFGRHLTAGEMVGQVRAMLGAMPRKGGLTQAVNVVFMGMGEPLHNLNGVMAAFDILTHRHGLVLSDRHVAVSTSGLVPKIEAMAKMKRRPQLMVSIAAVTDGARSRLMPVNRAYPLERLMVCLERFPLRKRERIMLSYVLIAGVNDRREDALALAGMSKRFPSLVNVIPMNAHEASPGMDEPAEERLQHFCQILLSEGAFTTIRRSRGRDVAGACGQLALGSAV